MRFTLARPRHKHRKARPLVRRIAPVAGPAVLVAGVAGATVAWPSGDFTLEPDATTSSLAALERPQSIARGAERTTPAPTQDAEAEAPTVAPTTTPSPAEESPAPTAEAEPAEEAPEATEEPAPEPEPEPVPTAVGTMFATAGLNVRTGPGTDYDVVTVLERGTEVDITGTSEGGFSQVLIDGEAYWVSSTYLSEDEPAAEEDDGISQAPCPDGSGVESGLTADAIRVHRAVCHQFPGVDSYGGVRSGGGEHSTGHALDIMVSSSLGDSIAAWLRENYQALGISELIWEQRIWTVERSSEGWRWMEDRGSATANHYDHIHVTVYGNSGTV